MNLTQVEYFLAVADKLNFTIAAKALFISQPALSKQITLLEKELDTKLFIRDCRRVKLTRAGEKFKEELQNVVKILDNAKENAMAIGNEEKGVFRIGCFDGAIINDYLPSVLRKIKNEFLETKIIIKRNNFMDLRESLANEDVDMIFTLDFELPELYFYHSKSVIARKSALIYSNESPLANKEKVLLKDFVEIPLLITSPKISEGAFRSTLELMNKLGLNNLNIKKMDNFTTLLTYLEMGDGFALLSEDVADKRNGLNKFPLPDDEYNRFVIAAWKNQNPIIDFLMDS